VGSRFHPSDPDREIGNQMKSTLKIVDLGSDIDQLNLETDQLLIRLKTNSVANNLSRETSNLTAEIYT